MNEASRKVAVLALPKSRSKQVMGDCQVLTSYIAETFPLF